MKKNLLKLCLLVVVVVVGALLLWRRPVSFWEMTGADKDAVYSLSASSFEMGVENGQPYSYGYVLQSTSPTDGAAAELLSLLERGQYRPSLRNLLPWPADSAGGDGDRDSRYTFHLVFTWGEAGEHAVFLTYLDSDLISLSTEDHDGFLVYRPTDRAALDDLGAFLVENGILND